MEDEIDEYFTRTRVDIERREQVESRPLPDKKLVIYFTPRSGSSWLTDLIQQSRKLGVGHELFNPNFVPNIANGVQGLNRDDYIVQAQKRFNTRLGVFSFEITAHQLDRLFPDPDPFMATFNDEKSYPVWLIRRDIIAQGVSLAKMVRTKVAHSPEATALDRAKLDAGFDYDAENIRRWTMHILNAERRNEALFDLYGIEPRRICYEDMMAAGPDRVRNMFIQLLDLKKHGWPELELKHEKLGTSQNTDYADRFRREEADFVAEIEAERAPMLDRIGPID